MQNQPNLNNFSMSITTTISTMTIVESPQRNVTLPQHAYVVILCDGAEGVFDQSAIDNDVATE